MCEIGNHEKKVQLLDVCVVVLADTKLSSAQYFKTEMEPAELDREKLCHRRDLKSLRGI